jgi:hypothetical protein
VDTTTPIRKSACRVYHNLLKDYEFWSRAHRIVVEKKSQRRAKNFGAPAKSLKTGAPRPTKMGTIASPWRHDAVTCGAPRSVKSMMAGDFANRLG